MTFTRRQFLQAGALMIAQAKTPSGGIFLSGPSSVAIRQGQTISLTYQLTQSKGQSLPTSYSISGLPRGLTAKFLPTACKPNCQTTLTLTATPDALPGSYTLLIRAQNSRDVAIMTTFCDIVLNSPVDLVYALSFPGNDAKSASTPMTAIIFANPHNNGLPMWGPSNAGVTVVRKIRFRTQTTSGDNPNRYVAMFWYSDNDSFTGSYEWGFHPYPGTGTPTNADPYWEIPNQGMDFYLNKNGVAVHCATDTWFTQALRITRNANGSKTLVFYFNLPSTSNDNVIERITDTDWGLSEPPQPQLTIGDSPWFIQYQHETFSGDQGPIKIFDKVLSEADMLSEAADFTRLVTTDGQAHIWWGKKSFDTVDDLTCDYGTGRSFTWFDASYKATLELIS